MILLLTDSSTACISAHAFVVVADILLVVNVLPLDPVVKRMVVVGGEETGVPASVVVLGLIVECDSVVPGVVIIPVETVGALVVPTIGGSTR